LVWTEIIRREIQFIDLGEDEQTRQLARLQDDIYSLLQTDGFGRPFRIFAGEQRAIGESMISDGVRGLECVGYATFLDRLAKFPDALLEPVREDVRNLSARLPEALPRLVALQNALIDLLAFLNPEFIRFPEDRRLEGHQLIRPTPACNGGAPRAAEAEPRWASGARGNCGLLAGGRRR
jgi:hypothetical protein